MARTSLALLALLLISVSLFAAQGTPSVTGEWVESGGVLAYWFRPGGSGSSGVRSVRDGNVKYSSTVTWEQVKDIVVVKGIGSKTSFKYEKTEEGEFLLEMANAAPKKLKKFRN